MRSPDPTPNSDRLLCQLLKPVVRFLFHRGLRFQELLALLKQAVFEVAREELVRSGETANISRLAVLSGLQRKDVRALLDESTVSTGSLNLVTRIIGQWQNHPSYVSRKGVARELRYEGADSEFAELVRSVSADLNAYTVLFAMEQSGAVVKNGPLVKLIHKVHDPKGDSAAGLEMLAQDSAALIKAVEQNIFAKAKIPSLHITTFFDNLCVDDLESLKEWVLDAGTSFHEKARTHLAKHDKDTNPRLYRKQGGAKITLCSFSLIETPEGEGKV